MLLKILKLRLTTSPVESDETGSTEQTTQPIAGLSVSQKVTNILNSNSENNENANEYGDKVKVEHNLFMIVSCFGNFAVYLLTYKYYIICRRA